MVKSATHSTYGVKYGAAFDSFFSNTRWEHFTSTEGINVVEFTGTFYYDNSPAIATIQFVIAPEDGSFTIYHLSINGAAQSKLMLATPVQKVFESY